MGAPEQEKKKAIGKKVEGAAADAVAGAEKKAEGAAADAVAGAKMKTEGVAANATAGVKKKAEGVTEEVIAGARKKTKNVKAEGAAADAVAGAKKKAEEVTEEVIAGARKKIKNRKDKEEIVKTKQKSAIRNEEKERKVAGFEKRRAVKHKRTTSHKQQNRFEYEKTENFKERSSVEHKQAKGPKELSTFKRQRDSNFKKQSSAKQEKTVDGGGRGSQASRFSEAQPGSGSPKAAISSHPVELDPYFSTADVVEDILCEVKQIMDCEERSSIKQKQDFIRVRDPRHWEIIWRDKIRNVTLQIDKLEELQAADHNDDEEITSQAEDLKKLWKQVEGLSSRIMETLVGCDLDEFKEIYCRTVVRYAHVSLTVGPDNKSNDMFISERMRPSRAWDDVQGEMQKHMDQVIERGPKQEVVMRMERLVNKLGALPPHERLSEQEIAKERKQIRKVQVEFQLKHLGSIDDSSEEEWLGMLRCHDRVEFMVKKANGLCDALEQRNRSKTKMAGNEVLLTKEAKTRKTIWAPDARRRLRVPATSLKLASAWKPASSIVRVSNPEPEPFFEPEETKEFCDWGPLCGKGVDCPSKHLHVDRLVEMHWAQKENPEMLPLCVKKGFIFREVKKLWYQNIVYRVRMKPNRNVLMLQLPNKIMIKIMKRLPPSSISSLARASLRLSWIARDDYLWQTKTRLDYPGIRDKLEDKDNDSEPNPWKTPTVKQSTKADPTWEEVYRGLHFARRKQRAFDIWIGVLEAEQNRH